MEDKAKNGHRTRFKSEIRELSCVGELEWTIGGEW